MDRTKFLNLAKKINEHSLDAKRLDGLLKEVWGSDAAEVLYLRSGMLCSVLSELSENIIKAADMEE